MGGANQYWYSSSKRVKVKFCGRLPRFNEFLSRHQVSCLLVATTVIGLREFKEKKEKKKNMDKMEKL